MLTSYSIVLPMNRLGTIILIIFLQLTSCNARPWEVQVHEKEYAGTFVPHLIQGLDTWIASMLSQAPVPLVGAGAALAYIGYAGTVLLTSDTAVTPAIRGRSDDTSTDLLSGIADNVINEALGSTASAVAFRRAGARALHHGASILRRGLNMFSKATGALYSTLSTSRRVLSSDCVAVRLCRIGQMTGMKWPMLGVLLRSLDSADLDEYSRAIIDGTTIGDCAAIYPNCPIVS